MPAAAIASVGESDAVQVKVDDNCNVLDTSHVEMVAVVEDQPALDETTSAAAEEVQVSRGVEIVIEHDAMLHRLEQPVEVSVEEKTEVEEIVKTESPVDVSSVNSELASYQDVN